MHDVARVCTIGEEEAAATPRSGGGDDDDGSDEERSDECAAKQRCDCGAAGDTIFRAVRNDK